MTVDPRRITAWQALAAFVAGVGLLAWLMHSRAVGLSGGAEAVAHARA